MSPPSKKNAKPETKPAAKKTATTKKPSESAVIASNIRKLIFQATKKKPAEQHRGTLPYISSGSFMVDHLIGGTLLDGKPKCPGYPRKRIIEIYGPEASGKTTLALHAIAEVQRTGGVAMFLDFEQALDQDYAASVGVNVKNKDTFIYYQPTTLEQGFQMMFIGIKLGVDIVVVDSVAAMVSAKELVKKLDKSAQIGIRAKAMAEMLPKLVVWLGGFESGKPANKRGGTSAVFINQTRVNIDTGGYGGGKGSSENTPGGKALKFFAYLRIKAQKLSTETIKKPDPTTGKERSYPYGNHTQVRIIKSKIDAKEGWTADIFIRFGQGIDDYYSVIETAAFNKIIKKKGAWYTFKDEQFQGRDKLRTYLMEHPKEFKELQGQVLAAIRSERDDVEPDEAGGVLVSMAEEMGMDPDDFASDDDMDEDGLADFYGHMGNDGEAGDGESEGEPEEEEESEGDDVELDG